MPAPLLQIRGIAKAFRGVQALDGVDLTISAGEVHGLMGENGAGKSTLIKVLTGVHPFDTGTIQFEGQSISPRSPREAEEVGISTVYQEINLVPTLSVADNILLGRQPTRFGCICRRVANERVHHALSRVGVKIDPDRALGSYSIAVQQMVAIARALDVRARLLILDEPTSSLDEREVEFLFTMIRQFRGEGLAVLFVTHFLDQVYSVTDRITVLRNGKLAGEFATAELPRLKLIGAMLGRTVEELPHIESKPVSGAVAKQERPVLEARGLGRRGGVVSVDVNVAAGETVGLAGLLGSGRTETAKMLFGVDPAEKGEIRINDEQVAIRSPAQAIQHGLAFCSEDRKGEGIVPHLSVRENLILAMQARRGPLRLLSDREQQTLADHYIRALQIKTPDAETPIQNLSGGNQQKVLLARWLATQPKLLIVDEPTRGVDVGAKAEIEKLIESLRSRGMAVIFISSEIEEVVRLSQRVVVLRDRKKVGELAGDEVSEDRLLRMIAHHDA
jgi:galactofuranose transport system ATP-binding protein